MIKRIKIWLRVRKYQKVAKNDWIIDGRITLRHKVRQFIGIHGKINDELLFNIPFMKNVYNKKLNRLLNKLINLIPAI